MDASITNEQRNADPAAEGGGGSGKGLAQVGGVKTARGGYWDLYLGRLQAQLFAAYVRCNISMYTGRCWHLPLCQFCNAGAHGRPVSTAIMCVCVQLGCMHWYRPYYCPVLSYVVLHTAHCTHPNSQRVV